MDTKLCHKCKKEKPISEFRRQTGSYLQDGFFTWCAECQSTAEKERYEKNKKYYIWNVREWQRENRAQVLEYKKRYRDKKRTELHKKKAEKSDNQQST